MSKKINRIGLRYGRLIVIAESPSVNSRSMWLCRCDCGKEKVISGECLQSGKTQSCGCLYLESASKLNKKHGMCNTRLFYIWQSMRHRCTIKNDRAYKNYGARGIKVCEEWSKDFMNFYNWAMNNGYTDKLTIDRIDSNGNYEPSNCRWVDMIVQGNNRRGVHIVEYHGKKDTLSNMCRTLNLNVKTIGARMRKRNISFEQAVDTYVNKSHFKEWYEYSN